MISGKREKMNKRSFAVVFICLVFTFSVLGAVFMVGKGKELENDPSSNRKKVVINYDTAVISYLGPEGTYTEEACKLFFDNKGSYTPCETVDDAVQELVEGRSTYAVIPQENTIGGATIDYIDVLLKTEDVSVVGEVELPISQNLLTVKGAKQEDIKTVYSHKQGILQGKDWVEDNLPGAELVEVSSTAEGARMVSEGNDPSCAAIASIGCKDVYGLDVLAEGIQKNDENKTRFYVLSKDDPAKADAGRLAFVAKGYSYELPKLMKELYSQGMKLVAIHDRPEKSKLGKYNYVIECSDSDYDDYIKVMSKSTFDFRFLGCFDCK